MADAFSKEVARVVAAQLAQASGFTAAQDSALEILGELLLQHIEAVATHAHRIAEEAHRHDINAVDVVAALEEMDNCALPELEQYYKMKMVPPLPLPPYPIKKQAKEFVSFQQKKEEPPPHIPSFLPAFPDPHTYQHTPTYPTQAPNPRAQQEAQHQRAQASRQQAEDALLSLSQSLLKCAGPVLAEDTSLTPEDNPFLAPPAFALHAEPSSTSAAAERGLHAATASAVGRLQPPPAAHDVPPVGLSAAAPRLGGLLAAPDVDDGVDGEEAVREVGLGHMQPSAAAPSAAGAGWGADNVTLGPSSDWATATLEHAALFASQRQDGVDHPGTGKDIPHQQGPSKRARHGISDDARRRAGQILDAGAYAMEQLGREEL